VHYLPSLTCWRLKLPSRAVVSLENPNVKETAELVRDALSEHKTLVIIGNCWVEYRGRASSKLEAGERIVMIKEDGSVLVHRPTGYEPVNWQPPGCIFQTHVVDKVLQIRAVRRKPQESIRLFFDRIYLVSVLSLTDLGEFALYASEEDMQKAILLEPSLIEPDFKPISHEKKVEPGFIDVYGIDKHGKFVVVEIKRKTASREAALQLAKYVESIRSMVNRQVRGILAAPHMGKGVQKLLATLGLDFKPLDPRKCAEIIRKSETKKLAEFFK
jgi:RecB family endonuclease NucS